MVWIYRDPLGYHDDEEFPTKKEAMEYAEIMEDDDCMETLAELNVFEKMRANHLKTREVKKHVDTC